MELDEYKLIIKVRAPRKVTATPPSLETIRRKRTHSIVKKIKSNLWFETLFAFVFLMMACYVVLRPASIYLQVYGLIMLAYCVWFIYYLSGLYHLINEQDTGLFPVSLSLRRLINIIKRFIALYFQLTMIMIPVLLILAFLIGYLNTSSASPGSLPHFPLQSFKIYAGASLAWVVIMYFFTKWYIRKMYSTHLEKLAGQLTELQNGL